MAFEENFIQEYLLEDYDFSPINMLVLYEYPLTIEQFKDFQSFENIIKRTLRKLFPINYVDSKYLKEICLDIASKNGLMTFIKILLSQGVKLNRLNKTCNRAPIHFATEGGHVDTLEVLLSEPTVNPNLQAGQQTALHIAVNRNDEKCVLLLLQKGASANIANSEGQTAIYLAAVNKQRNIVELILQEHWQYIDLDSYRDHNNRTIQEVIHQNLPELLLERSKYQCRYMHDVKYYLAVNDEINFLKNMLIDEKTFSSMTEELLKKATEKDLRKAVMGILHWLKDREEHSKRFIVEQVAHTAIEKGRYAILRELVKVVPEIATGLILDACVQLKKQRNQVTDTRFHISDWLECMKLMLDQGVNIRQLVDDKLNTPLHYVAKSGYGDAVTLFLNLDSYIGHMNEFNIPPIADIPESILSNYFDNCIQMRMNEKTNGYVIEFNYRCLMPPVAETHDFGTRELEVLKYIAQKDNLKYLLKHPLLSSFLYLKWQRIRGYLLTNFIIYVIFYFLLNIYVLSIAYSQKKESNTYALLSITIDSLIDILKDFLIEMYRNSIFLAYISFLLIFLIFREILQLVCCRWHYVKDYTNWLQIALYGMTICLLCGADNLFSMTVIPLLSSWELMILISRFPRISTGIMIYRTVFYSFVRFVLPYIFVILVFALVFYLFFNDVNDEEFNTFGRSIFKTIIMLTGEFDISSSLDKHDNCWIRVWCHIVFVIFVFLMAIVLMNMLNGLAVSDTAEILSKTEMIELINRIYLIAYYENVACAFGQLRYYSSRNPKSRKFFGSLFNTIFLFPRQLRNGKISFNICDSLNIHDNNWICVPRKFENNDIYYTTRKMDHDIITKAKQIILNKNQLSDNDKIMIALDRVQEAMGIASNRIEVLN